MSADPNQPRPASTASTPVVIQSLTPTGITGAVPPPLARVASEAIPVAIVPAPVHVGHPVYMGHPVEMGVLEGAPPVVIGEPRKQNAFMAYWRKAGGGSLTISLLVHAGLIVLFIMLVTVTVKEPKVDFLPGGGSKQGAEASSQLAHQVQQKKRTLMNKSTPMRKVTAANANAAIVLPDVPIDAVDVPDMAIPLGGGMSGSGGMGKAGSGGGFGTGRGIGGQAGFTSLPPSMKSRCSPVERIRKLKENGGSPECEKAVSSALEYLKSKQNPDGSWGKKYRPAMTGFALLCYLGRCETPDSNFYGDTVMKGLLYLVEVSKSNPKGLITEDPNGHYTYEHGIATYALGEMYSLARMGTKTLPGVKEAFEKGVKLIIDGQAPGGGWGYTYNKAGNDLSVIGWQFQALKAAKLSGLQIPGLSKSIERVVENLEKFQTKDGGFGNTGSGAYNQWSLSGVGILGLQTFTSNKSALIKKGLKFAYDFQTKEPPTWKNGNVGGHGKPTLYGWYYYAQCYFQNGGAEMKFWNETALPEILKNQNKDGSWTGSGSILTQGGDNIFTTALCTLMLEVYYRYLKVGDREETSIFDRSR